MNERTGETTIGSQAETFVQGNPSKQQVVLENFDDETPIDKIQLTSQERDEALSRALSKKRARVREARYVRKLHEPKAEKRRLTKDQYMAVIQKRFTEQGIALSVDTDNREVIEILCEYFSEDPAFEDRHESYSLKKGLIVWGPVGCGKTLLMTCLQFNTKSGFQVVPCRRVEAEYADKKGGSQVIDWYVGIPQYPLLQGWCFDDLGTEDVAMNYGNRKDVMESIVSARYTECAMGTTHFTTNMKMDQIEEMYGKRFRSRLREMCNLVAFPEAAKDRRI